MAVTTIDGIPHRDGRPMVLLAPAWRAPEQAGRAREAARELRAEGWQAVTLLDDTSVARDAARRAGLAVVEAPAFADATAAWTALLQGALLLGGDETALAGLRHALRLAGEPAAWSSIDLPAPWLARGNPAELLAFGPRGGSVDLPSRPGAVHLLDPETGDLLGILAAEPGDEVSLRLDPRPIAVYLGPNRYQPDEWITRPDASARVD